MEIIEIEREYYDLLNKNPFCTFNNSAFCELNKHKVEQIYYLVFRDSHIRFTLCAGINKGTIKLPFSAPYVMLDSISKNNRLESYFEAITLLNDWAKKKSCQSVLITLPPLSYASTEISMLYSALCSTGYSTKYVNLNQELHLSDFTANYIDSLNVKARQKLKKAIDYNLTFEKTEDIAQAYNIIKTNRTERGFPLWMSLQDIIDTHNLIDIDFFLVKDSQSVAIASAIVYRINFFILRIVYWGNLGKYVHLHPMNFMAYHIVEYYRNTPIRLIDIGQSYEDGSPNWGLFDFKKSIGCQCSPAFTLEKKITL